MSTLASPSDLDALEATFQSALSSSQLSVLESVDLAARKGSFAAIPEFIAPRLRAELDRSYGGKLYSHQAEALLALGQKQDICLETATASGKSLVFVAWAQHLIETTGDATILALYPARALVQDQFQKWEQLVGANVGIVDGSVPTANRLQILKSKSVVLMTPDVCHAWLLPSWTHPEAHRFLTRLRLLVLDEAHVYEGAFGSNMAFLMRRLQAASRSYQIIVCTATLGRPESFIAQLTGRTPVIFDKSKDGSPAPAKRVLLAKPGESRLSSIASFLRSLSSSLDSPFLAFADSRRLVEQVVAISERRREDRGENEGILPYRSGYEEEDRRAIEKALSTSALKGVVSTSALELGLDIGDLRAVILLDVPQTAKSLWQRLGRVGRRREGIALIIQGRRSNSALSLSALLERPPEASWLYLENKYLQYANVLCAAVEFEASAPEAPNLEPFKSLPQTFQQLLLNELDQTEAIPADLVPMKAMFSLGPHLQFPLRSGFDRQLEIVNPPSRRLGKAAMAQAMREAYPGAVYFYLAKPWRITHWNNRTGQAMAGVEKRGVTTKPDSQSMIFPRFTDGGILNAFCGDNCFVVESHLQVSERLLGFTEQVGERRTAFRYGPGSAYSQRPITRFIETTGVCWSFPGHVGRDEAIATWVLRAFSDAEGIHGRDLGTGRFHSERSPFSTTPVRGLCVYDATNGSLRLTQALAGDFGRFLALAAELAIEEGDRVSASDIAQLLEAEPVLTRRESEDDPRIPSENVDKENITQVIAPGEQAILTLASGEELVSVGGCRFTPQGIVYDVQPESGAPLTIRAGLLRPLWGTTKVAWFNLLTGEIELQASGPQQEG